jgi:putative acetyltransferase
MDTNGITERRFVRTDSDDLDFQKLVEALDADLKFRDGEDNVFYAQFNKITTIKHAIVAYEQNVAGGLWCNQTI